MKYQENAEKLTCTRCNELQEFHCNLVYSKGGRVCLDCKEETRADDDRAFDRFQNSRGIY